MVLTKWCKFPMGTPKVFRAIGVLLIVRTRRA